MNSEASNKSLLVVAARPLDRLKGFLVPRPSGCVLLIAPCASIHTFGMGFSLDIAFFDARGKVLQTKRGITPGQIRKCPGAYGVLERRAADSKWFIPGEELQLCL